MLLLELKVSYNRNSVGASELTRLATAARTEVWDKTLPFGTDSLRLLPEAYWERVSGILWELEERFERVLDGAPGHLMHTILPYPVLPEPGVPELHRQLANDLQERELLASYALMLRIKETLEHVVDRLAVDYVKGEAVLRRFHDSLFYNLSSENALYRAFNDDLFRDERLTTLCAGISTVVAHHPKLVRKDAGLRHSLRDACKFLIDVVSKA